MKFQKMAAVAVCGLLALVFSCSKSDGSGSQEAPGKAEKVTLTAMIGDTDVKLGIDAVAAAAEEKFNIHIEFELKPGGEEGNNLVRSRLATGDMTDLLIYNSGSLFKTLDPQNYFYDLSGEAYVVNLNESFKSTVSVDGKTYGIPFSSSQGGAWLYNRTVCQELGLGIPMTWKELMANCEKIKQAGKTAVIGAYGSGWPAVVPLYADEYNVVAQVPGFVQRYTENKIKYANTPAALRGFEKTLDVSRYFNADYNALTYDQALEMLVAGDGVYFPMLTSALSSIYDLYGDEVNNIGVFAQPSDDPNISGLTVWMPSAFYLNKDCAHIEAALTWLEYYISNEGLNIYSSKIRPDGPYMIKGVSLPDNSYAGVLEMQKYFDEGHTAPAFEFETPIYGLNIGKPLTAMVAGNMTPVQAAAEYDNDLAKSAIQLGLEGW